MVVDDIVEGSATSGRVRGIDIVAGYLYQHDVELETRLPLVVSACGRYRMTWRDSFDTLRPSGRRDYQLLYVHSGRAVFYKYEHPYRVGAGTMVLYLPGEPQRYEYRAQDKTEVYWVHFAGSDASRVLSYAGFTGDAQTDPMVPGRQMRPRDANIVHTGVQPQYSQIFGEMVRELQVRRKGFEDLVSLDFRRLLVQVRRCRSEESQDGVKRAAMVVHRSVEYFHRHFSERISIGDYARGHSMSVGWFIRSFRDLTGVSPLRYITLIRLNEAKMLLESTDYPVGEIADMVGYDNPLYFSRLFTAYFGRPPSRCRG
ncbi:MAG: AraC family transcriptional regulator [Bifidobacterium sp.]|nr:AraC family transcriptional regulator [Bifidobacterium sp.]MCI1864911.1 AraC family transcriptional regulator [Bifidobacterium sp.]